MFLEYDVCLAAVNETVDTLTEEIATLESKMAQAEELQTKIDDFDHFFAEYLKNN